MGDKQRIIELQRQVRIARTALEKVFFGHDRKEPHRIAGDALDEMRSLDKPLPLAGLLGWEKRQ